MVRGKNNNKIIIKLWEIYKEKIKGLYFKVLGYRILFFIKYILWYYFLECLEYVFKLFID